ncbi:glycosyltransferase family A protein [Brucella endophytica]|uniref:glycosyltransferase family A protein n=1 Tax=Brucella endophytica TaxID=1963359 RepID=UPI00166B162B|nr:glycosyltransferase family A protein [Brucella endophytica]
MSNSPKRISLLLPTRGRRKLVHRFLDSVLDTAAHPESIEVIICTDDDDPASFDIDFPGLSLKQIVVSRWSMGAYNAICLEQASGDISVAVNDDVIIRTKGWDEKIRLVDEKYPDGIYLAYGNDLFKGRKLCTFPIMSRRMTELMFAAYPHIYRGAFIDVHLMDIFMRLSQKGFERLIYLDDVIFEHLHYRVDPAALDETYMERPRFADDHVFMGLIDQRKAEARRLVMAIRAPGMALPPELPPAFQPVSLGFLSAPWIILSRLAMDAQLPLAWRLYLFVWMNARYYYSFITRSAK